MRRSTLLALVALGTLASFGACTNDFDQFEPVDGFPDTTSTSTTSGGGMGGDGGGGGLPTSTTTTATSTTSGTAGGGTGEDCLDGTDDDGDGETDCADADSCGQTHACVPEVPGGWNGYAVLYEGSPNQAPACDGDFPNNDYEGNDQLMAEPTVCGACTCTPQNVVCNPAQLTVYAQANCAGNSAVGPQPQPGTCAAVPGNLNINAYRANAPTATAGACQAAGGASDPPPPSWGVLGRLCARPDLGGGCGNGEVCAPTQVGAPFGASVCVWRDGDVACPQGFGDKHIFTNDVIDNRDCTACTCGAATATCTATTTVYQNNNCQNAIESIANDGNCVNGNDGNSIMTTTNATASCPSLGGDPVGSILPGNSQTTVCCVVP